MSATAFLTLEQEYNKDAQIENLRNEILNLKSNIKLLEKENAELKQKEFDRTKLNPEADCLCLYTTNTGDNCRVYGESAKLEKYITNCPDLAHKIKRNGGTTDWGDFLLFDNIASARTFLLINGFRFMYETKS